MVWIRDLFERTCQSIDIHNPVGTGKALDDITLHEWVTRENLGETAIASVRVWTRAMLGVEPEDMSALYFLDYCKSGGGLLQMRSDKSGGGQYLKIDGGKTSSRPNIAMEPSSWPPGTQKISIGLAALLQPESIILGSPVRSIEQTPEGVLVSSGKGDILCKRVIVSIPTPLYKEIIFTPPLPEAKQQLCKSNKLGYQVKVMLLYSAPWWRAHGLCGLLQSFVGPVCVTRDSSVDQKQSYSLTCFVSGDPGIELSRSTQEVRFKAVLAQIERTFGPLVKGQVPQPLAITEHEWAKDAWAQGCPCPVSGPGVMTSFGHALRSPHGKVHFVGTETAFEWKGYMDGAVRSGTRGAREVVHMLERSKI
jgi:monoamine oxidase